jgi:glycosyl hydrolase family 85
MKKTLFVASGLAFVAMAGNAQQLKEGYIQWPNSYALHRYVEAWTPGQDLKQTYSGESLSPEAWEDEEFFTSRVKLRPLITNTATQIYPELTGVKDKKLLFWVPCGLALEGQYHQGCLPNAKFDSEVFSAWSYVTHFGEWTSPYGWVPGGFADAAHKHGVLVSGVASIPNAALTGNWLDCMSAMGSSFATDEGAEKLAKFLMYHGSDGMGYNSEFSTNSTIMSGIRTMHEKVVKNMKAKGHVGPENPWYGGTGDNGSIGFDQGLRNQQENFGNAGTPRTTLFLNYNWSTSTYFSTKLDSYIASSGRDSRDVYLGQNMQGGMSKDGGNGREWETHMNEGANYSIGLWGAHQNNLLFPGRASYGGTSMLMQKGYQNILEQWFTNAKRNPAAKMPLSTSTSLNVHPEFQGMSRMMSARSAYGWDLGEEPFITYFGLGNGQDYKIAGEVANATEWYNLGMQDYTPTWRWWWADEILGNEPSNIPANCMEAAYTWEDAWTGGSSLQITGSTTAPQYLHLFKTAFNVKTNDKVVVRYKLLNGSADLNFFYTKIGNEGTELTPAQTKIMTQAGDKDGKKIFKDEWYTVTMDVKTRGGLSAGDWALMGLKVANAKDLDVLIGEISIIRGTAATPSMPKIKLAKALANTVYGVDAKLIWSMDHSKAAGEPVYNTDVNTSHYRMWAQIENEDPVFVGATTSWAGILYRIPNPKHAGRVKLGVQAVSLDHKSASDIAWTTDWLTIPAHEVSEEVAIDKTCIKPGEEFRIGFVDPMHPNAVLSLYDHKGTKVATNNGNSIELVASLDEIGAYDLVANEGTDKESRYNCFAQVSSWEVGALPEITSLTVNGEESSDNVTFKMNEPIEFGYTGRQADGKGSAGIRTNYKILGGPMSEFGIGQYKSFSVSFWYRPTLYTDQQQNLMGVEDRTGGWPKNNWGWFWSELNSTGGVSAYTMRGSAANPNEYQYEYPASTALPLGAWTHVTMVFDYDSSNAMLMKLYLNGVYQVPSGWGLGNKDNSVDANGLPGRGPNRDVFDGGMWMHIMGGRGEKPGFSDGVIDDMTIWNGSITEEDIAKAMVGLDADNLPDNVQCFWDFDSNYDEASKAFVSKGKNTTAHFGSFDLIQGEKEGQSVQTFIEPELQAGCPYVKGDGFTVTTVPTWSARQSAIEIVDGNDKEGKAKIAFGANGDKTVKLTLKNSWGEDSAEYPVVHISNEEYNAIDGIDADVTGGIKTYSINKTIFVEFADGGNYEVSVYNVSGMLEGRDARYVNAGEVMNIGIANSGVYLISVAKDGRQLRTIKVINK